MERRIPRRPLRDEEQGFPPVAAQGNLPPMPQTDIVPPQEPPTPTPAVSGLPAGNLQPVQAPGGSPSLPAAPVIGKEEIAKAMDTLRKYKSGKARLESRIVASEQWWKQRQWGYFSDRGNPKDEHKNSAWLFNTINAKYADAIEAYPEPNILPREEGDKGEAQMLSSIVPLVLEQNDFEECYSDVSWQKLKQGTGVYGVFWDKDKLNGLGDITVRKIDVLNMFWEPGVTDIQASRNFFTTELVDYDLLQEMYPGLLDDMPTTGKSFEPREYIYDDHVDTTNKAVVIDWYYHKRQGGRNVLHYVKFVDDVVLFATENDPQMRETGLYDHGKYPFVLDPLFPIEGSPCGRGFIDIGRDTQEDIDRLDQAIMKSALMGAQPRYLVRQGGDINEEEFADWRKPFVHTTSTNLGEDSIRQMDVTPLSGIYLEVLNSKVSELRETAGNNEAANGSVPSGVTAASAIAALQEQAGKTSKAATRSAYRAYSKVVSMVIELIRQFYDLPRKFRIIGERGQEQYVQFSNEHIKPQSQGVDFGVDMGYRQPIFDIQVSAAKMTVYSKTTQNELALQLFNLGLLNPESADQALALLDIMDFAHKDVIEQKISQNGTMYQQLIQFQQLAMQLAMQTGRPEIVEQVSSMILQGNQQNGQATQLAEIESPLTQPAASGHTLNGRPNTIVNKAASRSAASNQPT